MLLVADLRKLDREGPLRALARAAGMTDFSVYGYRSSAQISAADQPASSSAWRN